MSTLLAPLLGLLLSAAPAEATYSILAIDPDTREVGVAGATCGPFVWGIAGVAPGEGVVAAQYATWRRGRREAVDQLLEGDAPDEILDWLLTEDRRPELRQWAILRLDGSFASATGDEVEGNAEVIAGDGFSVQGNTLRPGVVKAAAAAVEAAAGQPLEDRLLAGLLAGAEAGGDKRCSAKDAAKSAFLYVAGPDDRAREPTVEVRASGAGAPWEVAEELRDGRMSCSAPGGRAVGAGWGLVGLVGAALLRRGRRSAR